MNQFMLSVSAAYFGFALGIYITAAGILETYFYAFLIAGIAATLGVVLTLTSAIR